MQNRADYIEQDQTQHHSQNGNGNGHKKPFELAPVKSAEEIAFEATRKIAPMVRKAVHFSRLPAAAKFFFDALLDLSFLHCYGGSGKGKIFISVRDLSRLLKHDKDSITAWRDLLIKERHVWTRDGWPKSEWRICALCAPPETDFRPSEWSYVMGKAAALEDGSLPTGLFLPQKGNSPSNTEEIGGHDTKTPDKVSDTFPSRVGSLRTDCPVPSPKNGGSLPTDCPVPSAGPGESLPTDQGSEPDSAAGSFRTNKETPEEIRSKETILTPPNTHTVPEFEPLDKKTVARLRPALGEKMIELCKQKIFAIEQSRDPIPNSLEVIVAYKRRIKDVKHWVAGQL